VSAPRRCACGARDGGIAAGSPAAEVHRQDYTEHEHLLAHSPSTHMTVGSSRGNRASGAAMGSPTAQGVPAYDSFPHFRSGGETIREVGRSLQRRGLENSAGSEALTGEGRWGGQSRGRVAVPSSFRCSCAKKKGEGGRRVLRPR
jgi:hypothetical protein